MRNVTLSLISASALLLGGCAIGPDYVRPEYPKAKSFRFVPSAPSAPVAEAWWESFGDPLLTAAIQTALSANHDLLTARAGVDALLGKFEQAEASLYPQINANTSLTRKSVDNASHGGYMLREGITDTYAASLSLASYEIDLFGKVRRVNEAARAMLLSSEYAQQTVRISVTAATAASYIRLASLQGQINLARENIAASQEIMRISELKYRHGTINQTALLQAESELQNAQAILSQLEGQKLAEEGNYNLLLGQSPANVTVGSIDSIRLPGVPEALPSELLQRRPDIAAAEAALIAANAQIGIAKAQYFPSIKLTGMLGVQSLELTDFLSNPAKIWEVAPSLSVPLFTAGRIKGEVKMAEAERDKAFYAYQKSIISALNDTDSGLGQRIKAAEQETFQNKRSEAAEKAYTQAKRRYEVGTIAYSDLLLAQQQWLQARQNLLIVRQNTLITTVSLYKALGGGWKK